MSDHVEVFRHGVWSARQHSDGWAVIHVPTGLVTARALTRGGVVTATKFLAKEHGSWWVNPADVMPRNAMDVALSAQAVASKRDYDPRNRDNQGATPASKSRRSNAAADRMRVHTYIRERGDYGATADEVLEALGLTHQSGSARVSELASKDGLIVLTNRTRRTRSGRPAGVYVAVEQ